MIHSWDCLITGGTALFRRILCAVFGHKFYGAGWLGGIRDDMVLKYNCERCKISTYVVEPGWHSRVRDSLHFFDHDLAGKIKDNTPDKYTQERNYDKELQIVNRTLPTGVLAVVHKCEVNDLLKLGYH